MLEEKLKSLNNYLLQFGDLNSEEWEDLKKDLIPFIVEKNTYLVKEGDTDVNLYFIHDGFARHYFIDCEGEEVSNWFNIPSSMATDYEAYTTGCKCKYSIVTLTAVSGFYINRTTLLELYVKFKNWEKIGRMMNQMYLISLMRRSHRLYYQSASERYKHFYATQPEIFQVAKLKHIASYLGMSLETLSRLRNKT